MAGVVSGFEYCYDEDDPVFLLNPDLKAMVQFDPYPFLLCRESLMEQAYRGCVVARFTLAHEIGHAVLHKATGLKLARYTIGSRKQYTKNRQFEVEANKFAGALLVHQDSIRPTETVLDIMRRCLVSQSVAEISIEDNRTWMIHKKMNPKK